MVRCMAVQYILLSNGQTVCLIVLFVEIATCGPKMDSYWVGGRVKASSGLDIELSCRTGWCTATGPTADVMRSMHGMATAPGPCLRSHPSALLLLNISITCTK